MLEGVIGDTDGIVWKTTSYQLSARLQTEKISALPYPCFTRVAMIEGKNGHVRSNQEILLLIGLCKDTEEFPSNLIWCARDLLAL